MGRGSRGEPALPFSLLLSCLPIGSRLLVSMVMALDWWAGPASRVQDRGKSRFLTGCQISATLLHTWPLRPLSQHAFAPFRVQRLGLETVFLIG